MKRILAIDPATSCGWAWSDGTDRHSGTWDLAALGSSSKHAHLAALRDRLLRVHAKYGIDHFGFEKVIHGRGMRSTEAHAEKIAIIKLVAVEIGATVHTGYGASSIKLFATGDGHAEKSQMMLACERLLKVVPRTDDEADALWILEMRLKGYEVTSKKSRPRRQSKKASKGEVTQQTFFEKGSRPRRVIRNPR
jgi:Holliday junction resolvasome RuvABC endonuclease subunit